MPNRSDLFRAVAILVLIAVSIATLAASNRHPSMPVAPRHPATAAAPDVLSAELRRCSVLDPQDAENPRCVAVWEENRWRFFGRPAQPLPPQLAPAANRRGDAR
jgi:conjugative transfer region protein TrbK